MTDQPLNPDDALAELRGLVVDVLSAVGREVPMYDGGPVVVPVDAAKIGRLAELAGALDSHMSHGGEAPEEWQPSVEVTATGRGYALPPF